MSSYIFISYRHEDRQEFAELIRQQSAHRFGKENVFLDSVSIGVGRDWEKSLKQKITKCDAMIVIIGPQWLKILREKHDKYEPDYVYYEIFSALDRKKLIIPICIDDTRLPLKEEIPPQIQGLLNFQGANIHSGLNFESECNQVLDNIEKELTRRGKKTVILPQGPDIKTHADYDTNVQEIDNFLKWLVEQEICDLVTLYLRDEIDVDEFNLIANQGLNDSSPMYGPLVFDDFRHHLEKPDLETFDPKISFSPDEEENREGFRAREGVKSRAVFKLAHKEKNIAALYLNWRQEQEFTDKQKDLIRGYKNQIFSAVEKMKGISRKRQSSNNAELKARRWIDYNATKEEFHENPDQLIIEAVHRFLGDFDRSRLRIELAREKDGKFMPVRRKDYETPGSPLVHASSKSTVDQEYYDWVAKTTRPKYLSKSPIDNSTVYKIVLPIRLPPDLSKCSGVLSVECVYKALIPEMVKPLCYLADHFGRIEYQANNRKE